MKKREWSDEKSAEITPERVYLNRRDFIVGAGAIMLGAAAADHIFPTPAEAGDGLPISRRVPGPAGELLTAREEATSFVNYYDLDLNKEEAVKYGARLRTRPWTVTVDGLVRKKKTFDIDKLMRRFPLEERVYRHRCVEGWSMVIPWTGFPLGEFIKLCEPAASARYVEFYTLHDPKQLPGQLSAILSWPYMEALRMDEARHPLALLAVGMYGQVLPGQNGAPIRLVTPWKYGFKGAKSIVRIRFVEKMPATAWMKAIPTEYGFFANVNPQVDHPRWSQSKENRIGEEGLRETLMFNGYGREVSSLYAGMDLKKYF
ncbi:MAG: protein-methionine-sulfoxide reductase catalytic subunit MsrP [Smithellaceae bacterium]|nr:protein-methionine-sulfoxide reductase catalytic subunit MsrP [Smithellaceae bacterium]